ncbi:L-gulono-gamma-lactone oxidase precursor [Gamsiella multidivaricata]|uniref:L-gulono-gamma-lactone oxidase precursor n=1 Tax=Gamsiella multidivaricata TaxID=101098 RepID=UPI00221ECB3A|nr:L-gulono-gamma-lactone oxidase precursor [Gamsiella multidivaricata]KAG0366606.1 hypothetical protein BGZ54_005113 [Gamsiella multidivaricata]KAI7816361.1 L-gulono-gamma-lactone oxidase precursor [Gamsiella multidivaricata]
MDSHRSEVDESVVVTTSDEYVSSSTTSVTITNVRSQTTAISTAEGSKGDIPPTSSDSKKIMSLEQELHSLSKPNKTFENWARTFRCAPEQYYIPTKEEDVAKIIRLARLSGKCVKAVGTGHSPSDLACTTGFMINTDKLNKSIKVDMERMTIEIEAGMKLHELNSILEKEGLAMSNLGSISDQSVAGAISTATHGSGAKYSTLSAAVVDLTMITANGESLYCSKLVNPDVFYAAICSMGSLGIITKLTLQCEPAFKLESKQEPAKLDDVLNNLDTIIHSAEHVRLWWYPHTDNVVIWRVNRTTKEISGSVSSWRTSRWFTFHFYQGLLYFCRFIPRLIPTLSRFMFWATQSKPLERVDKSVKIFNFDCLFAQYVNEWAIPWSRTAEAIRALDKFIETGSVQVETGVGVAAPIDEANNKTNGQSKVVKKEPGLKVHFPVEIRFVKKDDAWLSPAYGVNSCYIGIIMYRPYGKPVPYKRFWAGFEQIMASFEGRPHWAKAHSVEFEGLRQSYPMLEKFSRIREGLDPEGMFLNRNLRLHLVPPSTPTA